MNLQNVDVAIYTKAADAVAAGKYKLIYEKDGSIYGSRSGIPTCGDYCFNTFNKAPVAVEPVVVEPKAAVEETPINTAAEKESETETVEESDAPRNKRSRAQRALTKRLLR